MKDPVTVLLMLKRMDCNDGVASYCETLIKGLQARGDRVVIISGPVTQFYGSASRYQAISKAVADWIVLPELRTKLLKLSGIRRILAAIRQHSVNVISPQGLSLLPLTFLLSKLTRLPVIATYHPSMGGGAASNVATSHSIKAKLAYRVLLTVFRPDRLIAISKETASFFQADCGVDARRIALINNGIDTAFYRPPTGAERQDALTRFSIPAGALVCALSGRLNFNKGHDIVIDAIRSLRRTNPALQVICLFPGAGDEAEAIKAYAFQDDADSQSFQFLGFTDTETLRQVYWATDIGLLPSRFEGFGISMVEAMACGCVAIRTPGGGWQEQIVDGSNGFVIPFNDSQALADRILELTDPHRRELLCRNAASYAGAHFSQETMIVKTSDLYREVASPAPKLITLR